MEEKLNKLLSAVSPLDDVAMEKARERQAQLAKPPGSLGRLEDLSVQLAGITGRVHNKMGRTHLLVFAADNGVVAEGVSSAPQSVTLMQTVNLTRGKTGASVLAKHFGSGITVCDVGVNADIKEKAVLNRKIAYGTQNIASGPAMTRQQAVTAILTGAKLAAETDADALGVGEMGIGNTTTSSAVTAALLQCEAEEVTGRGAGLTDQGLTRKQQVVRTALETYDLWHADAFTVLQTVGGLDIAGLTGMCIGGALWHVPIVLDGVISMAAALVAERLFPGVREYLLPSHLGKEPAAVKLADALQLSPVIHAGMALGEGTGAVMMFTLLDMAMCIYGQSATFSEIKVEQYRR